MWSRRLPFAAFVSLASVIGGAAPSEAAAPAGQWWNASYLHRQKLNLVAGSSAIPTQYSVRLQFDHAGLVSALQSLASGDDIRVAYWNGSGWVELDRRLDDQSAWNSATTQVWFRTQAAIGASATDDNYYLYYGYPGAGAPPANWASVFVFYDDFTDGVFDAARWNCVDPLNLTPPAACTESAAAPGTISLQSDSALYANATYSLGTNTRWEARLRLPSGSPTATRFFNYWGASDMTGGPGDPYFNDWTTLYNDTQHHAETADDGNRTNVVVAPVTVTAFHVYTFDREALTGVRFFQDGTPLAFRNTDVPNANLQVLVWNDDTTANGIVLDWARVRRYVTPEPTVSLNAEETAAQMRIISGQYTGDGLDNRGILVGFQPDAVVVKRDEDGRFGMIRTSTMAGDFTKPLDPTGGAAFAGGIKSLTATGFVLGTDPNINAAGATFYWIALKGAPGQMVVGSYLGDDTDNRDITVVGFQPDYVWVLPQDGFGPVHRTSTMAGDVSYDFRRSSVGSDRIQAMIATGFQVGTSASVNSGSGSKLYHYVAWKNTAGRIQVGTYIGTGVDGQVLDILGFTPEWVIVKRDPDTATWGHMNHKPWSTGPNVDYGLFFSDRVGTIHEIEQLRPLGFMVGYDGPGDDSNESGILYHYVALGPHTTSPCSSLATTVDGAYAGYRVAAPASCELGFGRPGGGGVHLLFDLEHDPGRLYDLAGSDVAAKEPGLWSDEIGGVAGTNYQSGRNITGFRITPLEVTGTRVKMRQEAFFQAPDTGPILAGVKGSGDYAIYPTGRMALHWVRRYTNTAAINYTFQQLQTVVDYKGVGNPLHNWLTYTDDGAIPPARTAPPNHAFVLDQIEQPEVRTDILTILSKDWAAETSADAASDGTNLFLEADWNSGAGSISAGSPPEGWDFLFYLKPTNLVDNTDPAVTSRSADYRTPAALTINGGQGSRWSAASESTSAAGDWFNEGEAAYPLDMDPTLGLDFDIDGTGGNPRYKPFFKIRQWRSLVDAPVVSLEGTLLTKNVDYKADVKPVSRSHWASTLNWHCTMESTTACDSGDLDVGIGVAGSTTGTAATSARYGGGLLFTANTDKVVASTSDFGPSVGAIDFWYQPRYASNDSARYLLWYWQSFTSPTYNCFTFEKTAANTLLLQAIVGATNQVCTIGGATYSASVSVASGAYAWRASDWVHLKASWNSSGLAGSRKLRVVVNGVEAATSGTFVAPGGSSTLTFGGCSLNCPGNAGANPNGVLDEVLIYGGLDYNSYDTNSPLAFGGMTSDAGESLTDTGKNATFSLTALGGGRQGSYLYFGADAQLRGLNVSLQTAGVWSVAGTLAWEYWNGTQWASLSGLTDTTSAFTRSGTVYWTSDPAGWSPYSVNGGPDLYYLRLHLASGAYATLPVERIVKTDVLLFQYCGDITAPSQTFSFSPPSPTAVGLMSFSASPGDSSVALEWRTGSELNNLGFHLYRGRSADGPGTRLTSSLIPGLGSSPLGQAYSWLDTGLTNGTRYYYRLEDVDTSSVSTFHGPVSAVPSAPGQGGGDDGGGEGTGDGEGEPGGTSCPTWVLAAAPDAISPVCTRHEDPDSVSLQILARDSSSATLELRTGGFWTLRDAAGTVRVFVPGLEFPSDPMAPALPLRRALVDAVVGKGVELVSTELFDLRTFRGLRPAAVGAREIAANRDGTVAPVRRSLAAPLFRRGYLPSEVARLAGTVFQGERKSAVVEMTPVRFSGSGLVLAGRVRVKLAFAGVVAGESGAGSRGRLASRRKAPFPDVLAQLYTSQRGLHAIGYEALFPGRPRGLSTRFLRLQRQGEAVAFHVEPEGPFFGPGSMLYFYADRTASPTDYSSAVAYELVRSRAGWRMMRGTATPAGAAVGSSSVGFASFETNRIYQPGLLEAEDVWLWQAAISTVAAPPPVPFSLVGVATSLEEAARLVVHLQGGSQSGVVADHHVRVLLNGVEAGEATFAGKKPYRLEAAVPASLLKEGTNELSVVNVGDTGVYSLAFLDRFEVTYPQASVLRGGVFEGVWSEGGTVEVAGVAGPGVILRDAAQSAPEGSAVTWLTGFEASGSSVRFQAEAGHGYHVACRDGLLTPRVGTIRYSTLRQVSNQADYLVIAPREFLEAAARLLERRRGQGLSSQAVAFEEIASEFGHGQASAEAIRAFLSYAYHSWRRPSPRYVLLLGDATSDPRHFLSTSWPSPLPALWEKTSYLWTASDPALAAVNGGDELPDLAIGRLPATTREEAEALVSKVLRWEETGHGLSGNAVLVADTPDQGGDFDADVEDVRSSFLSDRATTTLRVQVLRGEARPAILDAFDEGSSLMSYVGHGGTAVWSSSNVLNTWDVPSLLAQSRQPVLLTMDCLNGYFVAPNLDALPEALLKAEGRGVVAAVSPSGLSLDGPAHEYHRALMAELVSKRHERLGDAVLAAQETYAETGLMPELLTVYQLLGDPALQIR